MKKVLCSITLSLITSFLFSQTITTIAGTSAGYSGDGGPATAAQLNQPTGIAFDAAGNTYIADDANNVIRKIGISTGIITTVAGTGTAGYSGDGAAATAAQLNAPWGVRVDAANNIYIADASNNVIRKVDGTTGIITTIAGTGVAGYSGDGGLATSAQLNFCSGVAVDGAGNIYISDDNNDYIRKVDISGIITTIAGTGVCGYSGDGGPATAAAICFPVGLQTDAAGNVYLSDNGNSVVRKINVSTGIITTIAGNGTSGYSGDGGPATSARLQFNFDVTFAPDGSFYIADWANNVVRFVNTSGIISTYAGNGSAGFSGDGGPARSAQLNGPIAVNLDAGGRLYIADWGNNRVRKVSVITPVTGVGPALPDTVRVTGGADVGLSAGNTGQFHARGGISYLWQPANGLSDSTIADPYVTIDTTSQTYVVRIETNPGVFVYDTVVARLGTLSVSSLPTCANWVSNGDFETYQYGYACLFNGFTGGGVLDWQDGGKFYGNSCVSVSSPAPTTCDYFSTFNGPSGCLTGVTHNFFGNMSPHSANSYGGLYLWTTCYNSPNPSTTCSTTSEWYEYLQQHLKCRLVTGQTYSVSFYTGYASGAEYNCADIGLLLSNGAPPVNSAGSQITATPQINGNVASTPVGNWLAVTGTVTGANQNYLTIGNFTPGTNCPSYVNSHPTSEADYNYVDDVSITPVPPTIAITPVNSNTVCLGLGPVPTYTLHETNSPGNLCTWAGPGTVSVNPTNPSFAYVTPPSTPGIYTYTCTVNLGCSFCTTIQNTVTIYVDSLTTGPPITVTNSPNPVCKGTNEILHAFGGSGSPPVYIWSPLNSNIVIAGTHNQIAVVHTSSLTPGVYTYSVSTSGCVGMGTATFTVNPLPVVTVNSDTICAGVPVTLTANGANTYTWTPATGLSATTGSTVIATDNSTHTYIVTGTDTNGCKNTAFATVFILPTPPLSISYSPQPACSGQNVNITFNGPYTSYTVAPTGQTFTATPGTFTYSTTAPNTTSVYTVASTNQFGCPGTPTTFTLHVIPTPTIAVTASTLTVCAGAAVTLTASGSTGPNQYTWTASNPPPIGSNHFTISENPTVTTTYSVTGHGAGGCTNTATITINVNPSPTISVTPSNTTICSGSSFQYSVSTNGTSVAWTPTTGLSCGTCINPVASPTTGVSIGIYTYSVTATNALGCHVQAVTQITVQPTPVVTATVNPVSLCPGQQAVIHATGVGPSGSYTLDPGGIVHYANTVGATNFSVTPAATTIYTVTGAYGTCTNTATVSVTVKPTPTVTVSSPTICVGTAAILTATGANTYVWSPGAGNPAANPHTTGIYPTAGTFTNVSVVGTSSACPSAPVNATITVLSNPTFSITVTTPPSGCSTTVTPSNTICVGTTAILTASDPTLSYTWNPGGLNGTSASVTPTVTTTYTVTGDNGSCVSTQTITVAVSTCKCSGGSPLPHSGTFTGNSFSLNNNGTITGVCNLNNVTVQCSYSVSLTVAPSSTLNISGSHFYACNNMWQGIIVQPGGVVNVTNNSLIEDAIVAIDNNPTNTIQTAASPTINVVNSVFNCNRTSIRQAYYQNPNTSNYSTSQFNVVNSVFTCRCNISYPIVSAQLRTLTNNVTGTPSMANPDLSDFFSVGGLPSADLKAPFTGQPAFEGIHLENDGPSLAMLPSIVNFVYQVAGGQMNIFDNHTYGINALNTSFRVSLSTFQFPRLTGNPPLFIPILGGYGINAINNIPDRYNGIYVDNSRFINQVRGIYSVNYFDMDVHTNTLSSKQTIVAFGSPPSITPRQGTVGMFFKTPRFIKANMSNNNVANINNCIDFVIDASSGYNGGNGEFVGPVTINQNTFADVFPGNSYTNRYIGTAIVVDNVLTPPTTNSVVSGGGTQIQIQNNTITKAYDGILVRNHQYQEVRDENNVISLQNYPTVTTIPTQAAIEHDHVLFNNGSGAGNDIYQNTVTGFTSSFAIPSAFEPKKGIWCNLTANHYVTCNNVLNTGRGMEFSGLNSHTFWRLNNMTSCGEGFVLSANAGGGVIGTQGGNGDGSDNKWSVFGPFNSETFVDNGCTANNSILYVRNAGGYAPSFNASAGGGFAYSNTFPTSSSNLIDAHSGSTSYACGTLPPAIVIHPGNGNSNVGGRSSNQSNTQSASSSLSMLEQIVLDSLPYVSDTAQNTFINKNMVYRLIKADSTLMDSSSILRNFYTSNTNSTWALFCQIEDSMQNLNYPYVNSLLGSFAPASVIESNYKRFYQIYMNAMQGTCNQSDTTDLETLANSCPRLNGAVVYQARAFHNSYYNEFKHYEDNCPGNNEVTNNRVSSVLQKAKSGFTLNFFPNPTTGMIYVSLNDGGIHTYQLEVYDISGKLVLKQDLRMENGIGKFKLDAENGIYMMNLLSTTNQVPGIYKIIINK